MSRLILAVTLALLTASTAFAKDAPRETPAALVEAYNALADSILGLKRSEHEFVQAILDHHYRAAKMHQEAEDYGKAAANMALFASEGDNAVAGIRKRLIEGGHHHNAAGEAEGIYEAGFVIVTREAKKELLKATKDMRGAKGKKRARKAWRKFKDSANPLLGITD